MATAIRDITYKCGHQEQRDLTTKKPFERDRFAQWLTTKPCRDCDPQQKKKKEQWIAARRAEEAEQARRSEKRLGLQPLEGPPSIQGWATRVRVNLIIAAFDVLDGVDEDEFAVIVAEPAGQIDAAGWWIDNKDIDPAELPDLLAAALTDDTATARTGTENPY